MVSVQKVYPNQSTPQEMLKALPEVAPITGAITFPRKPVPGFGTGDLTGCFGYDPEPFENLDPLNWNQLVHTVDDKDL